MLHRFQGVWGLDVREDVQLRNLTRFALGGRAHGLVDASTEDALARALVIVYDAGVTHAVIGGGTNLIPADEGFPGVILRYTAKAIEANGVLVTVEAGAVLQDLVDFAISRGLKGLETMTGIPGWVGGAVYGNAGAYGHSIQERIEWVRIFDGKQFREIGNCACEFQYRESIFKKRKEWILVSAGLRLEPGDPEVLRQTAEDILKIRNQKYPPGMCCAGSIFKNLILSGLGSEVQAQIPAKVIREGKVPSAFFLEEVGAKGMVNGGIRVADYHANLIYNSGEGTSRELREIVDTLKLRVKSTYGLELEEEVQYL
jgi:UDP-N-acetylmuramate dehydrogenase